MFLSERRRNSLAHNLKKLASPRSLSRLVANPGLAVQHARSFFTDVNMDSNIFQDVEKNGAASLAKFASSIVPLSDNKDWLENTDRDTRELETLFTQRGSDKSTHHDYHLVYGKLLAGKRRDQLNILEVGLGTNNIDVPSNMGLWGKPGASLRAFRDWAPAAQVFGADVDSRILFTEERITTSWVDQTDPASLAALAQTLTPRKFDLIIDDGLHLPHANINMLIAFLPLISSTGAYVVEDIEAGHEDYWRAINPLLSAKYDCKLVRAKGGLLFVIKPRMAMG